MTFPTEFPEYPADRMPTIPEGFEDTSWRNDTCPSFLSKALGVYLYTDFPDPNEREWRGVKRFVLKSVDEGGVGSIDLHEAEQWWEVLAWLERRRRFIAAYRASRLEATSLEGRSGFAYGDRTLDVSKPIDVAEIGWIERVDDSFPEEVRGKAYYLCVANAELFSDDLAELEIALIDHMMQNGMGEKDIIGVETGQLPDPALLSQVFVGVLGQWLTHEEFLEMQARNAKEADAVCHSHDFCDANMAMSEALERLGVDEETFDPGDQAQADIWNKAWELSMPALGRAA